MFILLADDDYLFGLRLREMLAAAGHCVTIVHDGFELERKSRQVRPDAVLLDIAMPRRGGLEALRSIREDGGLADVPVIAITARRDTALLDCALSSGVHAVLSKPIDDEQLRQAIAGLAPRPCMEWSDAA
ncbi:response regulator [Altererythrobacter sp. CAU 1778]